MLCEIGENMVKLEEWAEKEMDKLGMNEIEYCNYKGCNMQDIVYDTEDREEEYDEEDW